MAWSSSFWSMIRETASRSGPATGWSGAACGDDLPGGRRTSQQGLVHNRHNAVHHLPARHSPALPKGRHQHDERHGLAQLHETIVEQAGAGCNRADGNAVGNMVRCPSEGAGDSMQGSANNDVAGELLQWFERCGYFRRCDPKRRAREGASYKKGYEIRFVLDSEHSVQTLRQLLAAAGLAAGSPYRKNRRIILPVYGRQAVEWMASLLPKGRERVRRGFAADGRRLVRRSPAARGPAARIKE
jgi:hypothetical protein